MTWSGREMRSTIHQNGAVVLSQEQVELTEPDDEVVVRIEATPVNSRDIGPSLGPADLSWNEKVGDENHYILTLNVSPTHPLPLPADSVSRCPLAMKMRGRNSWLIPDWTSTIERSHFP
jgi:hypothetical protein